MENLSISISLGGKVMANMKEMRSKVQDGKLNENGYIVPGLGDAGDRLFGTK